MRKRSHLCTAICMILVFAMFVTILPESAQAASSGFTMDLADLTREATILSYGKVKKGGTTFVNSTIKAPEGTTLFLWVAKENCYQERLCSAYYEGRLWPTYTTAIVDLKNTEYNTAYRAWRNRVKKQGKKIKTKTALIGDVTDPLHYYYIYAKPKAADKNCIAAFAVGADVSVINENYNSEWAEILWEQNIGYIQKDCLNYTDAYLAGPELRSQQDIKAAKKAKLTYNGILKNYNKNLTKKEFCRLAVNWYKATGHTLPKQSTKSPYTDTKDSYVIMAYQLGIVKGTANKKFQPDKKLTCEQYNSQMKNLLSVTNDEKKVYDYVKESTINSSGVSRETAIRNFYRAYRLVQEKDYLISSDDSAVSYDVYTISPADNPNICLDVWGWDQSVGAEIGLYDKNGGKNQYFFLYNVNGFTIINVLFSQKTLNGTKQKVYQDRRWYDSEKMTIEYNDDGTVCIKNGDGLYLDIQGGKAVSGAHLKFAPKSGSSTQKFVFNLHHLTSLK